MASVSLSSSDLKNQDGDIIAGPSNSQNEISQAVRDAIQISIRNFCIIQNNDGVSETLNRLLENPRGVVFDEPTIDEKWVDQLVEEKICTGAICIYDFYKNLPELEDLKFDLHEGRLFWKGENFDDKVFLAILKNFELIGKIESILLRWETDHLRRVANMRVDKMGSFGIGQKVQLHKTCEQVRFEFKFVQQIFLEFVEFYLSCKEVMQRNLLSKRNIEQFGKILDYI